jgi:GNAT superfamily N-acetyltransferase
MNIETEMEMLWKMQMNGIIENDKLIKYSGDGINIIMTSSWMGLVSYSVLDKSKGNNYLRMIFIPKEHRGKGHGHGIVKQLIKACLENGINAIETESDNNSMGFFEKLGFVLMENEPDNRMILNF